MLDLENYAFREGLTPLSAEELNRRFYALVRRLHDLESLRVNWDAAVAEVQAKGVQRIDEAVRPLLDALSLDLQGLVERGEQDLESQALAVAAKLDEVEARMAQAEARFTEMIQAGELLVTRPDALAMIRDSRAGMIVEWEASTIPVLDDGLPMGLELDGSLVDLGVYPRLMRTWCGPAANATAPAWNRGNAVGARDASGGFIRIQDRRGEFSRGWDHGRGIDAGRALGSAQTADNAPHTHSVDPPGTWAGTENVNHVHSVDPPNTATTADPGHTHSAYVRGAGATIKDTPGSECAWTAATSAAGAHAHTVDIAAFNSGAQSVAHQHYVDIAAFNSASQGTEGRPRNVAVMYIVLV